MIWWHRIRNLATISLHNYSISWNKASLKEYPLLMYMAFLSPLVPISTGVFRFTMMHREMKILLSLLSIGFVADFLALFVYAGTHSAPWITHFYILVQLGISMVIISAWQESQKAKRIFWSLIGLYVIFWLYAKLSFEPLNGSFDITGSISAVILTLSAGYTLFIVIGNRLQPLLNNYRFWVLLAFVLYFICTLLPIALQTILFNRSTKMLVIAWSITWIATILSSVIYAKGFLCPQMQA